MSQYPAESVELPSKGWYYPKDHPLASGFINLKFMTAREEDILTSRTLIQRGVVIDRLLESLIENKSINYSDILLGDKNGLMIASRIMGYGKNYEVTVTCSSCEEQHKTIVDLEQIGEKHIKLEENSRYKNEFDFSFPASKVQVKFKLLTVKDEREVSAALDSLKKKLKSEVTPEVTARMKKTIIAIDGNYDQKVINDFVDNMPVRDALAFRNYVKEINPDIDLNFDFSCPNPECLVTSRLEVPIDLSFFWPNAGI